MSTEQQKAPVAQKDFAAQLKAALKRALGGGTAGAIAMVCQVFSLMWMRTIMNYQYRYGTSLKDAAKKLYSEGGIPRFYKGIVPALVQGPLSRFGDTAANAGITSLLNNSEWVQNLAPGPKALIVTPAASLSAGLFRIFLMPVDTFKTVLQVEGSKGIPTIMAKYRAHGISTFYHGALAAWAATFAGHFPWFSTYNYLQARIPQTDDKLQKLLRQAGIGFTASVVSDSISNSIRVVKTYRQTNAEVVSYVQSVKNIVASDGVVGLLGRGLKTRIITNGCQGLMFSVLWKYFDEKFFHKPVPAAPASTASH